MTVSGIRSIFETGYYLKKFPALFFPSDVVVELEDPTITQVTEGSAALICARLSGRANFSIHAFLRPVGVAGSAQEGVDFAERDYSLVFSALSVDHKCANVTTLQDEVVEEEEMFTVELQLEQSISRVARAPKHSANISITDNDGEHQ